MCLQPLMVNGAKSIYASVNMALAKEAREVGDTKAVG